MKNDPTVEETHAVRERLAADFGVDWAVFSYRSSYVIPNTEWPANAGTNRCPGTV